MWMRYNINRCSNTAKQLTAGLGFLLISACLHTLKTLGLCLVAVKQNPNALQYVPEELKAEAELPF